MKIMHWLLVMTRMRPHKARLVHRMDHMAFRHLKKAFTSAPILAHVDTNKPFIMEADASDFALGSILSQQGDKKELHPVAFHLRKFDSAEINYEIHDK